MRFEDIPQFPKSHYEVDIAWGSLEKWITQDFTKINLEPDFQRGHVWNDSQRTAYVEYILMGGENAKLITANCPGWPYNPDVSQYELIDGLQRITAVRRFMAGTLPAFGHYLPEFTGHLRLTDQRFRWRVLALPNRKEVLRAYLLFNTGGVVHSQEEINRVRALLEGAE